MYQTKNPSTWNCTRPKLAADLMARGYKAKVTPNPWQPTKTMWVFKITWEMAIVVDNYYATKGKQTPKVIAEYLGEAQ